MKIAARILLILFLPSASLFAQDEKTEVGRYQIFSGTTEVLTQNGKAVSSSHEPVVIKIDTKTGDTWILVTMFTDGSGGQGWQGFGEYFEMRKSKPLKP